MKKVNPESRSRKTILCLSVSIVCILCFCAGLAIPTLVLQNAGQSDLSKLTQVMNLLETRYYYGQDSQEYADALVENALKGMATMSDDPHTSYFSIEEAQQFTNALAASSAGIGITFVPAGQDGIMVSDVFYDSPAAAGGLESGDIIVSIDGKNTAQLGSEGIIDLIGSLKDTPTAFSIVRNGESLELEVTPGQFDSSVVKSQGDGYGLIKITSFSENSGTEFNKAAKELQEAGIDTLILDLRNNTGGYLLAARQIAATLLPENSVVMKEQLKSGEENVLKVSDEFEQIPFEKIVVLQNGNSASASEVLIGALKDNLEDTVTTVGTTSYGKGTEQVSIPFSDGTSLKMTIAQWVSPNGTSINLTGYAPDVEIEPSALDAAAYKAWQDGQVIEADTVSFNAAPVQIWLQMLGYPADRTDTYFSYASSQALAAFQADHGLEATGIVDAPTFQSLLEAASQMSILNPLLDDQLAGAVEIAAAN